MANDDDGDVESQLELVVTVDDVKEIITADFECIKNVNDKNVEATKTYISDLISKCNFCTSQKEEENEDGDEEEITDENVDQGDLDADVPVVSISELLRGSITKVKVDMQVVRLLDQEDIKQTTTDMNELLTRHLEITVSKTNKEAKKEIVHKKVTILETVKQIANLNSGPEDGNKDVAATIIRELIEKSIADFDETKQNTQQLTDVTKNDFSEYIKTLFPLPKVTEENKQSEMFVKEDFLYLKDKVVNDLEERRKSIDQSIYETKRKLSSISEQMLEGVKNIPIKLLKNEVIGEEEECNIEKAESTSFTNETSNDDNEKN